MLVRNLISIDDEMDINYRQRRNYRKLRNSSNTINTIKSPPEHIPNYKEALKIHGLLASSSGSSGSGQSDFDEEYDKYKPPPLKIQENKVVVISPLMNIVNEKKNTEVQTINPVPVHNIRATGIVNENLYQTKNIKSIKNVKDSIADSSVITVSNIVEEYWKVLPNTSDCSTYIHNNVLQIPTTSYISKNIVDKKPLEFTKASMSENSNTHKSNHDCLKREISSDNVVEQTQIGSKYFTNNSIYLPKSRANEHQQPLFSQKPGKELNFEQKPPHVETFITASKYLNHRDIPSVPTNTKNTLPNRTINRHSSELNFKQKPPHLEEYMTASKSLNYGDIPSIPTNTKNTLSNRTINRHSSQSIPKYNISSQNSSSFQQNEEKQRATLGKSNESNNPFCIPEREIKTGNISTRKNNFTSSNVTDVSPVLNVPRPISEVVSENEYSTDLENLLDDEENCCLSCLNCCIPCRR